MQLVKAMIATQQDLPGQHYKVLLRMCISARDKALDDDRPDRIYTGGWEPLAIALGYNPDDPEKRAWTKVEVYRICRALTDRGLIKPLVDKPRQGTRQVWKIGEFLGRATTLTSGEG